MGWDGMGWDGMGWDGMGWDVLFCFVLLKMLWPDSYWSPPGYTHLRWWLHSCLYLPSTSFIPSQLVFKENKTNRRSARLSPDYLVSCVF